MEAVCPASIVNVSQVFFSSSIRTFDVVALTRPTVRYHLFESISIKLKVEFGFRLVSSASSARLEYVDDEQQEDDIVDMWTRTHEGN